MGVIIGAQRHVNCFDQGFKSFARHLAWGWQPIFFTEFNAGFDGLCFTTYIYSLFVLMKRNLEKSRFAITTCFIRCRTKNKISRIFAHPPLTLTGTFGTSR